MSNITPIHKALTGNEYTFIFHTDRPLTHDEKMRVCEKGHLALNEILRDELGDISDHNSSFSFK